METICEHCKAKLNIPDEKIPKNKAVRIACPKCKKKITLEATKEQNETGRFHLSFIEPTQAGGSAENGYGYGDYSDDEALGFYEEGTKLALVMENIPEHADKISSRFTFPFCDVILTPFCHENNLGKNHIKFNNLTEGLYLHRKYFNPDRSILELLKLKPNEKYVIVRFVAQTNKQFDEPFDFWLAEKVLGERIK